MSRGYRPTGKHHYATKTEPMRQHTHRQHRTRSGWHRFADSGQGKGHNVSLASQPENRGFGNGSVPRPEPRSGMTNTSPAKEASPNRGEGWHKFKPQSRLAPPEPNRGAGGDHWTRFPSGSGSNGMGRPPGRVMTKGSGSLPHWVCGGAFACNLLQVAFGVLLLTVHSLDERLPSLGRATGSVRLPANAIQQCSGESP